MNWCSIVSERCYAAAFDPRQRLCRLYYDSDPIETDSDNGDKFDLAIADASRLEPVEDSACPYPSYSAHTTPKEQSFQIFCDAGTYRYGGPFCPDNLLPWACPPHADSLDECLGYCSSAHPLCKGVTWDPEMSISFGNCLLLSDPANSSMVPETGDVVVHSALVLSNFTSEVSSECSDDDVYTSTNGLNFNATCFQTRAGAENYTATHKRSLTDCMETCSDSNESCLGVLFDMSMEAGFENCYLLNATGGSSKAGGGNITFARAIDRSPASSTPGDSSSSSGSAGDDKTGKANDTGDDRSKAWIAGPVVGAVVLLVALVAGILWWRRRKGRVYSYSARPEIAPDLDESQAVQSPPPYQSEEKSDAQETTCGRQRPAAELRDMPAEPHDNPNELPDGRSSPRELQA